MTVNRPTAKKPKPIRKPKNSGYALLAIFTLPRLAGGFFIIKKRNVTPQGFCAGSPFFIHGIISGRCPAETFRHDRWIVVIIGVILNLIQDLQRLLLSLRNEKRRVRGRFQIKFGMTLFLMKGRVGGKSFCYFFCFQKK